MNYKLFPKIHKDTLKQQSLMYYQIALGMMMTAVAKDNVSGFPSGFLYEEIGTVLRKMAHFPGDFEDYDFSHTGAFVMARDSYFNFYKQQRSFKGNISTEVFKNLQSAARVNVKLENECSYDRTVNNYLLFEVGKIFFEYRNQELKNSIWDSSREIIKEQNSELYVALQNHKQSDQGSFDVIDLVTKQDFKSLSKQAINLYQQLNNKQYIQKSIDILIENNNQPSLEWNEALGDLYNVMHETKTAKEYFLKAVDIHKKEGLAKDINSVKLFKKAGDLDSAAECYVNKIRKMKNYVGTKISFKPDRSTEFFFERFGDYHLELYRIKLKKERGY